MTKSKRKKNQKQSYPSQQLLSIKGPKRERLILERKNKGLTQKQLGEMIGCSGQTISHLESGRMNPNIELSIQLEAVLETPFFELFPDL